MAGISREAVISEARRVAGLFKYIALSLVPIASSAARCGASVCRLQTNPTQKLSNNYSRQVRGIPEALF
jgi:hypothetical protein